MFGDSDGIAIILCTTVALAGDCKPLYMRQCFLQFLLRNL